MVPKTVSGLREILSLVTAVLCFALLLADYGFGLSGRGLDAFMASLPFVYLVLLLVPDGRSIVLRLTDAAWTTLFLSLLLAALLILGVSVAAGALPAFRASGLARAFCIAGAILVSARILLWHLGRLLMRAIPAWALLPVTIAAVIAAGSLLLMLPAATTEGIAPIDAAFVSASATCVTGLSTVDIGSRFSTFGQIVILLLIQVGGIGLMSFVAFFALFLGHSVGLGESVSISRAMDSEFLSDLKRILASIIGWTLTIEASGAIILYTTWRPLVPSWTGLHTVWQSVFTSVSAFCNAGLSLEAANLERFSGSPATCLVVAMLIILGGLGFATLTALGASMTLRLRGTRTHRMPVQARLALVVTGILILSATALFAMLEWNSSLAGMPALERLANSFLEAVTPRTAGFDTIPTASLLPVTAWIFIFLMFIGASPGGTGGGVKTTTVGFLALAAVSLIRGRPTPEIWKRRIPLSDLQKASALLLLALMACAASSSLLVFTEMQAVESGRWSVFDLVFESVSAFGTVGLSMGVTSELTGAGRVVIILTMFLGRVGPATLAAVTARSRSLRYSYPESRIGIG